MLKEKPLPIYFEELVSDPNKEWKKIIKFLLDENEIRMPDKVSCSYYPIRTELNGL